MDEPVRRYLGAAIDEGAPLWRAALISMRGRLKVGRWLRFRASELLAPLDGFVWSARVGGVLVGADRYVAGAGTMTWKLGGVVPIVRSDGPDISHSAAARAGGEGIWLPTALLPRFGVRWRASTERDIVASFTVGATPVELHIEIDGAGTVQTVWFPRWGDPDRDGRFAWHRFGGTFTSSRRFAGVTVPNEGALGWHVGTDRWPAGEFFRYRLGGLEPLATVPDALRAS